MSKKRRSHRSGLPHGIVHGPLIKLAGRPRRRHGYELFALAVLLALGAGLYWWSTKASSPPAQESTTTTPVAATSAPEPASARFVGAKACADCHSAENTSWQDSQHAHAMQHAADATVLGDFNNVSFTYNNIVSSFFRRD